MCWVVLAAWGVCLGMGCEARRQVVLTTGSGLPW